MMVAAALFFAGASSWAQVERIRYEPPALWKKAGFYMALRGGAFLHQDNYSVYGDIVGAGGAAFGLLLDFGKSPHVPLSSVRMELEGSYIAQKNVRRTRGNEEDRWQAKGYMLLASLFFDLRTEHAIKPYVMVSGGYRNPSVKVTQNGSGEVLFYDPSGLMGFGAGFGVALHEDDSLILDMDYRYLHNLKNDGIGVGHMTFIGLRFLGL